MNLAKRLVLAGLALWAIAAEANASGEDGRTLPSIIADGSAQRFLRADAGERLRDARAAWARSDNERAARELDEAAAAMRAMARKAEAVVPSADLARAAAHVTRLGHILILEGGGEAVDLDEDLIGPELVIAEFDLALARLLLAHENEFSAGDALRHSARALAGAAKRMPAPAGRRADPAVDDAIFAARALTTTKADPAAVKAQVDQLDEAIEDARTAHVGG